MGMHRHADEDTQMNTVEDIWTTTAIEPAGHGR